jgi:exodeoxyribonuclease VII large subunit
MVADHASSTPTAAAEQTVPNQARIVQDWHALETRLNRALSAKLERFRRQLLELSSQLKDPASHIQKRGQGLDELVRRAEDALRERIDQKRRQLATLNETLLLRSPKLRQIEAKGTFTQLIRRQDHAIAAQFGDAQVRLAGLAQRLELLSPLSVLARGYAIAHAEDGRALRISSDVKPGDPIKLRLHQGSLLARVETLDP